MIDILRKKQPSDSWVVAVGVAALAKRVPSLEPARVDTVCEAWHQPEYCHRGQSAPRHNLITELVEVDECQLQKRNKVSPFIWRY